jgi:SAM-dependent methyltransferase
MKQTPIQDVHNEELLALLPRTATRLVEVGCSSGALAREYLKLNPDCEYVGVEIDPDYAEVARTRCTHVLTGSIETMDEERFKSLFPSDCWVFADVLEHLHDPWAVLRRIRQQISMGAVLVACLPNAQHWSIQARLNCGAFRYEDMGLMDRTHIRWFTRTTAIELFQTCGFEVVDGGARLVEESHREAGLKGVKAMAEAIGADVDRAIEDAKPIQWLIRATPAR